MENLSWYIYLVFVATSLLTLWIFFKATRYSKPVMLLAAAWILLQSVAGVLGFYNHVHSMTNRFPLLIFPPVIFFTALFFTTKGKAFIDGLNSRALTLLHIVRIPVEMVLFWLFINKLLPEAMTFEGRNFDILSGLSAPIIYYFCFVNRKIGKWGMVAWNMVCILLLLNVVINAVLSLPARYQPFGFEQPNLALGFFPFLLLPACLVPLVLFANIAVIRQVVKGKALPVKIHDK